MNEIKSTESLKSNCETCFDPNIFLKGNLILENNHLLSYEYENLSKETKLELKNSNNFNLDTFLKGDLVLINSGNDIFNSEEKEKIRIEVQVFDVLPKNDGRWSGEPGNSEWNPNGDVIPNNPQTNPEQISWEQILKKYGIDNIPFKNGEPDFSEISKGNVEIDDFTDDRSSNFSQADEKLAEQRGCTPEEVKQWREENKYTWHECKDCKTMQKVPREVHGNIPHSGGISEYKKNHVNN